jgi:hypothetical protein
LFRVLVPQLAGVVVERVERLADCVLITATAAGGWGSCPGCGTSSVRVHSRYQRRVADAPIAGAPVVIGLEVRERGRLRDPGLIDGWGSRRCCG